MKAYLIKRILVMIPTFFGITLIVFAVLNLAPGTPGGLRTADQASDGTGADTQESVRIFREQFNLDKPVVLNTLFMLEGAEVEQALRDALGEGGVGPAVRLQAEERLEDYGGYAVPRLADIVREAEARGEVRLRNAAFNRLQIAARRPLVTPFDPDPSPEVAALNREIDRENATLRSLRYESVDDDVAKAIKIEALLGFVDERAERWEYDFGDKLRILFLETRFASYLSNLVRLDFGVSLVSKRPVLDTLIEKLPYSLSLSVGSLVLAYLISIPIGIFSAVRSKSSADRVMTVVLFMLYSLPSFFVATLLLFFFSEGSYYESLRIFPTGGWQDANYQELTTLEQIRDVAWHLVLPLTCMTYGSFAALSRYMRTGLLDVIRADYVRTARAKGLPESEVIGRHAVRNGLLPVLTLLSGLLPAVLGGSVIIEYIFGIPGMGQWVIDSIYQRDYNAIMVVQLFSTILVLLGLLITDLSYALVDPRIRYE